MSVGVCVINRNGIALAADSAGTYDGNKMFYNSVNKVFKVSEKNICGAIIYGNLAIGSVSIEQLLKEFSKYLDTIDPISDFYDIVLKLQEYVRIKNSYYRFDNDEVSTCHELIAKLVNTWGGKIQSVIGTPDATDKIEEIIHELRDTVAKYRKVCNFDIAQYIDNTYHDYFNIEIEKIVPSIDSIGPYKQQLWTYICDHFNTALNNELPTSGVFFAGFGTDDAYAKYIKLDLRTVIGGELKFEEIERYDEAGGWARIRPLAQEDVVYTFCKGISQGYIEGIPQKIASLVANRINALPGFEETQKETLLNAFNGIEKDINDYIVTTIKNDHVNPLMKSVTLIDLPEMAFLAENLVNITSLKRTYALDGKQQTVGGPTDVAVLSKGDGFSWIKKK